MKTTTPRKKQFNGYPNLHIDMRVWNRDVNIPVLPDAALGFLIRYVMRVNSMCFPFGCCTTLDVHKLLNDENLGGLKNVSKQQLQQMSDEEIMNLLAIELPISEQLKLADSYEEGMHVHLGYSKKKTSAYVRVLENEGIFWRDPKGILWCPLFVDQFDEAVLAYRKGKRGSNPKAKNGAAKGGSIPAVSKKAAVIIHEPPVATLNCNSCSHRYMEERKQETAVPDFDLKPYYIQGYEAAKRRWRNLTEKGYHDWRQFVTYIIQEPQYRGMLIAKMVEPVDFTDIVAKYGFEPSKWERVIQKTLSKGLEPKHKLYFKLQDNMR